MSADLVQGGSPAIYTIKQGEGGEKKSMCTWGEGSRGWKTRELFPLLWLGLGCAPVPARTRTGSVPASASLPRGRLPSARN